MTDLVRYVWIFFIVGYNVDRQRFLVYEPIKELVARAKSGFQMMGDSLHSLATGMFGFRDFEAFISWRGFVVSFFALLSLVGVARGIYWLVCQLRRWLKGEEPESSTLTTSQVTYRRLDHLLGAWDWSGR